jgi:uncharacterized membrane protein
MLSAQTFMLLFRIVHILAGVLWVGSAFFVTVFLEPTVGELGPAAGPVMSHVMEKKKAGMVITGIAAFAVLGGLFLYWHDWHVFPSFGDWIGTAFAKSLTVGAVCAIVAFFLGALGIPPTINKMNALGAEIGVSGGAPTPEQGARMHALQQRLKFVSRTDLVLVTVAVLAMATARYW